jgi:hypothetical protein
MNTRHGRIGWLRWWSVGCVALAACSGSGSGSSNTPCTFTVTGATMASGNCGANARTAATATGNPSFSLLQGTAGPGMQNLVVSAAWPGMVVDGTYTSALGSSAGAVVFTTSNGETYAASAADPDGGTSGLGSYTITITGVDSLGLGEYNVHGTLTATMDAQPPLGFADAGPFAPPGTTDNLSVTF